MPRSSAAVVCGLCQHIPRHSLNEKRKKYYIGFCIPKIWQILKCSTMSFFKQKRLISEEWYIDRIFLSPLFFFSTCIFNNYLSGSLLDISASNDRFPHLNGDARIMRSTCLVSSLLPHLKSGIM